MYRVIFTVFMILPIVFSAQASSVHKWVDKQGITHYSDTIPDVEFEQMTVIKIVSKNNTANPEKDYYSIANQWKRLFEERIEREKIKLKKAEQKAGQSSSNSEVVYINEPYKEQYRVKYPIFIKHKYKHHYPNSRIGNRHINDLSRYRRSYCPNSYLSQRRGKVFSTSTHNRGLVLKIK